MTDKQGLNGRRAALSLWVVLLGLVVIFAAFVGVARATDSSAFCKSCHEMRPYYDSWVTGHHAKDAQCIDCHVDGGFGPRITHKFVALNEVYQHVFGNRLFPLSAPPAVPNSRCLRCHPAVNVKRVNFSHQLHASKATCQQCHFETGHVVTVADLRRAGVYNASIAVSRPVFQTAVVNGGKANIPGHQAVACSQCHDMAKTGCSACHGVPRNHPKTAARKDCAFCHATSGSFAFKHPAASVDCAPCHQPPRNHPKIASGKTCSLCHRAGGSWKFSHSSQGTDCAPCHQPPRNHPAFAQGQPCASCHRRPGVTWAFSHPSAGEHSFTSMPCTKCHPSGPPRVYCTCHRGRPPSD